MNFVPKLSFVLARYKVKSAKFTNFKLELYISREIVFQISIPVYWVRHFRRYIENMLVRPGLLKPL